MHCHSQKTQQRDDYSFHKIRLSIVLFIGQRQTAICYTDVMTPEDQQFLAKFEDLSLDPAEFDHKGHVRLAWLLLRSKPFAEALTHLSSGISRYATSLGAASKFHATLTFAFTCLVAERLANHDTFSGFIAAHPELLDQPSTLIGAYYSPARLDEPKAKSEIIPPDGKPLDHYLRQIAANKTQN